MKKNMGTADRIIRTVVAFVLLGLLLAGEISGLVGTILGIVAVVFLGTSLVSSCPIYMALKISTRKEAASQPR